MKKYIVRLTPEEQALLEGVVSKGRASARKIKHANILLKVDANRENWTDEKSAQSFCVSLNTVYLIRQRFVREGLESALNHKKQVRPSRLPILDGKKEARLIALSCRKAPEGRVKWTLRLLADKLVELGIVEGISHETVRQTLKKTN